MKTIIEKMSLKEILDMDTGVVDYWYSSAGDTFEDKIVWIYLKDGTVEKLEPSYIYKGYADKSIGDYSNNSGDKIYDVITRMGKKPEDIEKVEIEYSFIGCGRHEEETTIIYPEESLNLEQIKKEILDKIQEADDEKILYYYYKIFS